MTDKAFCDRLRKSMQNAGFNSHQLGIAIGMDKHHFSNILTGRRHPRLGTIQKILKILKDVDARWLIIGPQEEAKSMIPSDWDYLKSKNLPGRGVKPPRSPKRKRSLECEEI